MPHSGPPPIHRQSSAAGLNAPHNPPRPSGLPDSTEHAAHPPKQDQRQDAVWRLPLVRAGLAVPFASPWRRRPMHAGAASKSLAQKTNGALTNDNCAPEKFLACDVRKAHLTCVRIADWPISSGAIAVVVRIAAGVIHAFQFSERDPGIHDRPVCYCASSVMSRPLVRRLVRWIVAVLLLGQLAVAAYACPGLVANAADTEKRDAFGADCVMTDSHEALFADRAMSPVALDLESPNLCAEHCKAGQQSDQTSTLNVPGVAPPVAFENNPPLRVESRLRPTASFVNALVSACPPHAILHCVRRS